MILTFLIAFLFAGLLVFLRKTLIQLMPRYGSPAQRLHNNETLRLGGVNMIIAFLVYLLFLAPSDKPSNSLSDASIRENFLIFLGLLSPLYLMSFLEDIHITTRPKYRLIASLVPILIISFLMLSLYHHTHHTGWIISSLWIIYITSLMAFTTHGFNLIDGSNGIACFTAIIQLAMVTMLAYSLGDEHIVMYGLALISIMIGVIVWNYPFGLLFIGDTGAYFLGIMSSTFAIIITLSHVEVSFMFPLAILIYPVVEVAFSLLRRLFAREAIFVADRLHLHHLLLAYFNQRSDKNLHPNMLAAIIWITQLPLALFALYNYNNSVLLGVGIIVFVLLYLLTYQLISTSTRQA